VQTDISNGQQLAHDDWITTVIYTSLFTNKRAQNDEVPDDVSDPQGYWGDMFFNESYGSLLWTLRREKIINNLEGRVRTMCLDALAWLLRDNHIESLEVTTERVRGSSRIDILIQYTRDGIAQEQRESFNAA